MNGYGDEGDVQRAEGDERAEVFEVACPVCATPRGHACAISAELDRIYGDSGVHVGRIRAAFLAHVRQLAEKGLTADEVLAATIRRHYWRLGDVTRFARKHGLVLATKSRHAWAHIPAGDPLDYCGWPAWKRRCARCGLIKDTDRGQTAYYTVRWRTRRAEPGTRTKKREKYPELVYAGNRTPPCTAG